jgi:hypothetical protein
MMSSKPMLLNPSVAEGRRSHLWLATALHGASLLLGRWARQLTLGLRRQHTGEPVLEFYAEAGAPEGALYVDGRLVGHLEGVTRL